MGPPGEERAGPATTPSRPDNVTDATTIPAGRPWKDVATERRFQCDRQQWRRRIACARRLSHDAADELVAPRGRWSR